MYGDFGFRLPNSDAVKVLVGGAGNLLHIRNVWVEFMVKREEDVGEIRLLIWRGLLTTVLYTWRKYSYFRGPIWLY